MALKRTNLKPIQENAGESLAEAVELQLESPNTTHFSVIDADGMAVSNTYTLEATWGSRIVVHGAGFLLNNEMGDFNRKPGYTDVNGAIGTVPNRVAPRKRLHRIGEERVDQEVRPRAQHDRNDELPSANGSRRQRPEEHDAERERVQSTCTDVEGRLEIAPRVLATVVVGRRAGDEPVANEIEETVREDTRDHAVNHGHREHQRIGHRHIVVGARYPHDPARAHAGDGHDARKGHTFREREALHKIADGQGCPSESHSSQ